MQNLYSSAFTVTCAPSHNFLKIHEKMYFSLRCPVIFFKGMSAFFVMGNGSKIKIDSSVKSKKLNVKSYGTERVAGYGLRVMYKRVQRLKDPR